LVQRQAKYGASMLMRRCRSIAQGSVSIENDPSMKIDSASIKIRLATTDDDIRSLTDLLHRAYAKLGNMGLRFMAVDQSEDVTRQRMESGECYVAVADRTLLGTVLFRPPSLTKGSPWLDRRDVACISQLAVEPGLQRSGLGAMLMDWVEARAAESGANEIALDTAEPAHHLRSWYTTRGYRLIEFAQWKHTNYRSVILSKPVTRREPQWQGEASR
jgi:GNAT superfamily N-acetyltransferase